MTMQSPRGASDTVSANDIRRLVGDVEDATVAEILALQPSLADLEDVSVCLAGDQDVLAKSGHHVPVTVSRILEMLAEERAEPER